MGTGQLPVQANGVSNSLGRLFYGKTSTGKFSVLVSRFPSTFTRWVDKFNLPPSFSLEQERMSYHSLLSATKSSAGERARYSTTTLQRYSLLK